jgi:molybdopterin adenylyltransferase
LKVVVITISDRAHRGEYEDLSGPEIRRLLLETFPDADVQGLVIPDEEAEIMHAFRKCLDADFILTTGGTGISPRDITPETTAAYCDKELPGIAEVLRAESYRETPQAMLSRAYAGIKGRTIIVNFPGSVKAAAFCTRTFIPVMAHALLMRDGKGH